jgi:hypothetical protein
LIVCQILDEPNSLRILSEKLGTFDESVYFFFGYFLFVQSRSIVVVDDIVDGKGIAMINGAVNGELKFSVQQCILKFFTDLKYLNWSRCFHGNVINVKRFFSLFLLRRYFSLFLFIQLAPVVDYFINAPTQFTIKDSYRIAVVITGALCLIIQ